MSLKLFVDLGAGLGGASEAFFQDKKWKVIRVDNHELVQDVPCMYNLDYVSQTDTVVELIKHYLEQHNIEEVVIWASPECKEWSNGYASKKCTMRREGKIFVPNYSQLTSIVAIVQAIQPKYWIVENVMGGVEFINPILGEPTLIFRPYFLWGLFPLFSIDVSRSEKTDNDVHSSNPLRYHLRSKIPFQISNSLKQAIDNQTSLLEWLN
jgi:hypothetical protein